MNFIEFEDKTVDKALEKASKELKQPIENLQYDIVSHGSSGIFGLVGLKKAKIRVKTNSLKTIQKEAKQQARDLVKDAFKIEEDGQEPIPASEAEVEREDVGEDEDTTVTPEVLEKAVQYGKDILQKMTGFLSEGATVSAETSSGRIIFSVNGGNSSILIGKRGQTLEAIQYLIEKIVNKKSEQRIRVLVDVEGYLETRRDNLKKLASRMAEKAQKINKPVTIGQMNAYDRRIVHLHLKDNNEVRTQSIGEGYYRKLVIFPKKRKRSRNG